MSNEIDPIYTFLLEQVRYERDRSERLEAEVARLNNMATDKVVPALLMNIEALKKATNLAVALQRKQEIEAEAERYKREQQRSSDEYEL